MFNWPKWQSKVGDPKASGTHSVRIVCTEGFKNYYLGKLFCQQLSTLVKCIKYSGGPENKKYFPFEIS